jgi:hypothetical protein
VKLFVKRPAPFGQNQIELQAHNGHGNEKKPMVRLFIRACQFGPHLHKISIIQEIVDMTAFIQ